MKDQHTEERDRFTRLEDKSIKYLGAVTIAVSAYTFLIRWVAEQTLPPQTGIERLLVIFMVTTFLALIVAWSFVFRSIKLQNVARMPYDDAVLEMFKNNNAASAYVALAERYGEAISVRQKEYCKKLAYVEKAYTGIFLAGLSFSIFIFLLVVNEWIN
ncbi:hypothetical protein [Thiocapsa roseopersicina]|nr:hypothetical protein [Thiocapsa roseopersicina]